MTHRLSRLVAVVVAISAILFFGGPALAQTPLISALPKPEASGGVAQPHPPAEATRDDKLVGELRARLAEDQARLTLLETPGGLSAGAPPGTDEQSLRLRRIRVAFIVRTLEQQIADLTQLAGERIQRKAMEKELLSWPGLAAKPPYSILMADRLRTEFQAAETKLRGLQSRAELLQQAADRAKDSIKAAEKQLRQLNDQTETARTEADSKRLAWNREQISLQLRVAETSAGATETSRQLLDEEQAIAQLELQFARRKLESVNAKATFTAEDLAEVRSSLATEADKLAKEADRLTREQKRRQSAADAARQALAAARAAPSPQDAAAQAVAGARLRALELDYELKTAQLGSTAAQLDFLRQAADFNRAREAQWEARYSAQQGRDAASRLAIRESTGKLLAYLELQKKFLEQQSKSINDAAAEVEAREDHGNPAEMAFREALKATYAEQAAAAQRTLAALDSSTNLAQQMLAESGGGGVPRTITERREEWRAVVLRYAAAVWNFELLAVEDSIVVDGKVIAGTRSVTVGKVFTAILMTVIGYVLAIFLARLGERLLIQRFAWQPAHAGIVRRWVLVVESVLIFVIVLTWVKIPITVFAFLGGAVAIGLGFGMQTLLKNLISGLMILGERPYRLGDFIEVGNIRGRVVNIGLRASIVSDVNGIETIIPNSSFIEQNLTNWTHSSGQVRFNIKVGVAYGSSVRAVTQVLEEVAARHGQVLKDPPSEVIFEDFGSDALVFALHYWLDIGAGVLSRRVASDLRSMIDGAFADHGIVMAFPQRDVHLDAARPLPVRIINEGEAAANATPERPAHLP